MYIPAFWWHHVECLDHSISVSLSQPARSSLYHLVFGPRNVWATLFELRCRFAAWRPEGSQLPFDIDACEFLRAFKRAGGDVRTLARALHTSEDTVIERLSAYGVDAAATAPSSRAFGGTR